MISSVVAGSRGFSLPFTAFGRHYFQFVPLPGGVILLTVGILLAYFLSAELAKAPFFRRFEV